MRKVVLILFVYGLSSLIIGSVLAIPSIWSRLASAVISSSGTIVNPDDSSSQAAEASLPQDTNNQTSLDVIGYFTILASIGLFAIGLVMSRKRDRIPA